MACMSARKARNNQHTQDLIILCWKALDLALGQVCFFWCGAAPALIAMPRDGTQADQALTDNNGEEDCHEDEDTDMAMSEDSEEEIEASSDDEEEPSTPPPPIELPDRTTRGKRMKEVRGAFTYSWRTNDGTSAYPHRCWPYHMAIV